MLMLYEKKKKQKFFRYLISIKQQFALLEGTSTYKI